VKTGLVYISVLLAFAFQTGCGKAFFAAKNSSSDVTVPVVATTTNYYAEIGDEFPDQVEGDVVLTTARFSSQAKWSGSSSLEFELRLALRGDAARGETRVSASVPVGWSDAVQVVSATIPAGSNQYVLTGPDIADSVAPILKQGGNFWILIRVRSTGLDVNKSLNLSKVQIQAEGYVDLKSFSPLLNLVY
jgi:hypothetical protein